MDTFSRIRVFVRVVETGGFASAARALNLSTAMVSKHVAALEAHLGVRLLDRNTRNTTPTEAGRQYFDRCASVLAALAEAESELMDASGVLRGTLRITAPVEFGNAHLAPLVSRFLESHPHLKVSLDLSNQVVDLVAGGIDLAIRVARHLDTALAGQQLAVSRLMPLASPGYLKRFGSPQAPQDLDNHPALCFAVPTPMDAWTCECKGVKETVQLRPRLETSSSEALRVAAVQGAGITLLPSFVAGQDMAAGRLVALLPQHDFGALKIYAVYPHRRHLSPKVRAFVSFLSAYFGGNPMGDPFLPK